MRVLGLSGSLRADSHNSRLLRAAAELLPPGVAVVAYCLWAFAQDATARFPLHSVSIIPFVLFMLQYALLVERGEGGAPEDLVLRDRALLVLGGAWAATFAAAVAVG